MITIGLNRAQHAIWMAQNLLGDDTPIAVAQCLEIRGAVDPELLLAVVHDVSEEFGVSTTRLYTDGGEPRLSIGGHPGVMVERLSLGDTADPEAADPEAADPEAAAAEAMREMSAAPLPLDGPLIRYVLIELGPRRWTFYTRAHHVLVDGYAAELVMRHVAHRYRQATGQADGDPIPRDPRPVTVIREHERGYEQSPRHARDREYWRSVLATAPEPLRITDHAAHASIRTHVAGADLTPGTVRRLRETADRAAVPTVAVLVAAGALCLSRIADRTAVPLTLVTSTRTTAAVRAAAGTMSNLLPLVVDHRPGLPVDGHLRDVARTLSGALRHQQYRYEDMVAEAGGGSDPAGLVRLGPVLNLVPSVPDLSLGDGTDCDLRVLTTGPVTDLNINVYPGDADQLRVEIEVNADVHDQSSADAVLAGVLDDVAALCGARGDDDVDHLAPNAGVWRCEAPSVDVSETFADGYLRHRYSTRVAVVDEDGGPHTYREVAADAMGLAAELTARAQPGDVVAVVCERSSRSVVAAWAVAAARMCVLPIDPSLPQSRRQAMLAAGAPAVILGHGADFDIDLNRAHADGAPDVRLPTARLDSPAYLLFTSGSTGVPKGVCVPHRGVADLIVEIDASYDLATTSVVAHLASPGFDTAIVEMLAAAHAGATLVVVPPHIRGGADLAHYLAVHGVTHLLVTPGVLATLPDEAVPELTHVIVGGDVCPAPLIGRWARRATVRCAYGPSETTCSVMLTDPIDADEVGRRIPLGRPMSGVRLLVLDSRLRPVPRGGRGELYVCGPSLAIGILGSAATTAARFVGALDGSGERMYRTGDRVRRGADDQIWFVGRVDGQVKIRGVRVELAEIDRAVLEIGAASASATIAHDAPGGRRLHTYVVATGTGDTARRVRDGVRDRLGTAFTPTGVTVLDRLPLTVNNKLDRARLPAPTTVTRRAHRPPTDEFERVAVDAFEHALGVTEVGLDDDFLDLGGDSLSATAVVARIAAARGVRVGVRDVFTNATPAELADLVRTRTSSATIAPAITGDSINGSRSGPIPLAPGQRNVYARRDRIDHLISFATTIAAQIGVADVRRGVAAALDRHPMLRSRFADDETFAVDAVSDPDCWTVDELGRVDPTSLREYLFRPIDLAQHYPLRVGVGTEPDGSTVIAACLHHLAADGVSLRVMLSGMLTGVGATPDADYREYARTAGALAAENRIADIAHAAEVVHDVRSAGSADLAPRRPRVWEANGARVPIPLGAPEWAVVETTARDARVSVLTVVRAALALVIGRRTGADTVPVGALLSGRDDARWDNVVGMFVNTVCVPCRVETTVSETIAGVHRAENEAFAHATTAFADIVDALGPFPPDRHPLFQVMLTMDDYPTIAWNGLRLTPIPVDVAHCDLHFSVIPPRAGVDGAVEVLYATALFDEQTVRDVAAELVAALGTACLNA
ncbi:amino acid adenylation domain-containing protein [Gordonia sp. HY002]|uniref:amino acid adenylation domain-containing protein n=1 Tax=Gordonia zhenghanii TaxID=2911516 RepID=UPI001EEFBC1D|nr:amino acid adenylation domain-containing protein [Gordonia zhenghanii]MCF8571965.1 amino acid adenylation domain-containing protein [Gordonia zhenghanii]MCF8604183.1 amino acid adenylation domain-containing protein [Gordonia zhenghanii]